LIYDKIKFSETVSLLGRCQASHCACANWTYIFSRHPNNREVLHRTVRSLLSFGIVCLATGIPYELDRYHAKMRLIYGCPTGNQCIPKYMLASSVQTMGTGNNSQHQLTTAVTTKQENNQTLDLASHKSNNINFDANK